MFNIIRLRETASTNSYLKNLLNVEANSVSEGTVVCADFQTDGRGTDGNSWESEDGKNLLFSMALFPSNVDAVHQYELSKMVSLAILDVLKNEDDHFSIKWPNDIYWNDKKIAGILIENDLMGTNIHHSVVGIGLNVNQDTFVGNAPNPVSLTQITHKYYDRNTLLNTLVKQLYMFSLKLLQNGVGCFDDDYKSNLYHRQGFYEYQANGEIFTAEIADVLPIGHIILRTKTGEERTFAFKEVHYIL